MDLEPSAPLKVSTISQPSRQTCVWMCPPIEVCDVRRKVSVCISRTRGGTIEGLGNVHIATGSLGGRTLNLASCHLPFDAESRSDASMSISGGYGSNEEYESNE
jgi:hypothetical protein